MKFNELWQLPESIESNPTNELFAQFGGTYVGLRLARILSQGRSDVRIPDDYALLIDDPQDVGMAVAELPKSVRHGFVVKYSGSSETFSPESARGAYTSRSRVWTEQSNQEPAALVRESLQAAPQMTKALVLQQLIDGISVKGPFAAHIYKDRVIAESVRPGERQLATILEFENASTIERYQAPHIAARGSGHPNVELLRRVAFDLRGQVQFDINIEGYEVDGTIVLVQFRPIPSDVELNKQLRSTVREELRSNPSGWHQTSFVTGHGISNPTARAAGAHRVMVKPERDLRNCPEITAALMRGERVMVLDPYDAFHLEHTPAHLPEVQHRPNFCYVSVANLSPDQYLPIEKFQAIVDGEVGIMRCK